MKKPDKSVLHTYGNVYSESRLFEKIGKVAKKAGVKAVYAALLLYYAMVDENVPFKDKAMVVGALGYFILPLDLIPDALIGMGYGDDLAAMVMALKSIWNNFTPVTHERARKRLESWFGMVSDQEIKLF